MLDFVFVQQITKNDNIAFIFCFAVDFELKQN